MGVSSRYCVRSVLNLQIHIPIYTMASWVVSTQFDGLKYSTDGSSWISCDGASINKGRIAYGNNIWVANGIPETGRALIYSPDGVSWFDTSGAEFGGGGLYVELHLVPMLVDPLFGLL